MFNFKISNIVFRKWIVEIRNDDNSIKEIFYCPACGKENKSNFLNFCSNCGIPINATVATEEKETKFSELNNGDIFIYKGKSFFKFDAKTIDKEKDKNIIEKFERIFPFKFDDFIIFLKEKGEYHCNSLNLINCNPIKVSDKKWIKKYSYHF